MRRPKRRSLRPPPPYAMGQPSISGSVPVLGDWKKALCERGFNPQVNFISEVFGNPTGGVKQGARYEQRLELGLDGDMNQIAGIKGLIFHINSYAIAGQSLSTYNLYNYSAITFIAAHPAWLLFEAWAEYKLPGDKLSIRVGQLAADSDFFISELGPALSQLDLWLAEYFRRRSSERRARLSLRDAGRARQSLCERPAEPRRRHLQRRSDRRGLHRESRGSTTPRARISS